MEMLNLLLHNTSAKFPRTVALIFEDRASTFADLSRLTQSSGPRAGFELHPLFSQCPILHK
jgi:hypothetical protein